VGTTTPSEADGGAYKKEYAITNEVMAKSAAGNIERILNEKVWLDEVQILGDNLEGYIVVATISGFKKGISINNIPRKLDGFPIVIRVNGNPLNRTTKVHSLL
jgi:hypothetical protein